MGRSAVLLAWATAATTLPLLLLLLLRPAAAQTQAAGSCHRWNCPCPGDSGGPALPSVSKRYQSIYDRARHTRNRTQALLQRIETERFHGNPAFVRTLQQCVDRADVNCGFTHLNGQCQLEGLPVIGRLGPGSNLPADLAQVNSFLQACQTMLASIAVYVEQARNDEDATRLRSLSSLVDDIRQIEEDGIYFLLCDLRLYATAQDLPWLPNLSPSLMTMGCRSFSDRAPVDNRNYMVFYTLEKLLHNISTRLQQRNKRHFRPPALRRRARTRLFPSLQL